MGRLQTTTRVAAAAAVMASVAFVATAALAMVAPSGTAHAAEAECALVDATSKCTDDGTKVTVSVPKASDTPNTNDKKPNTNDTTKKTTTSGTTGNSGTSDGTGTLTSNNATLTPVTSTGDGTGQGSKDTAGDTGTGGTGNTKAEEKEAGPVRIGGLETNYRPSVNPWGGLVHATFVLSNEGNEKVSGKLVVKVYNLFGMQVGESRPYTITLDPSSSSTVEASIPGVFAWGPMSVRVAFEPDESSAKAIAKTLTASSTTGSTSDATATSTQAPRTSVGADTTTWGIPWTLLAVVALGLITWRVVAWRLNKIDEEGAVPGVPGAVFANGGVTA